MDFDPVDELCKLSASTSRERFLNFIEEVVEELGSEYFCFPKESDLKSIIAINSARGFTGCLGS